MMAMARRSQRACARSLGTIPNGRFGVLRVCVRKGPVALKVGKGVILAAQRRKQDGKRR